MKLPRRYYKQREKSVLQHPFSMQRLQNLYDLAWRMIVPYNDDGTAYNDAAEYIMYLRGLTEGLGLSYSSAWQSNDHFINAFNKSLNTSNPKKGFKVFRKELLKR